MLHGDVVSESAGREFPPYDTIYARALLKFDETGL